MNDFHCEPKVSVGNRRSADGFTGWYANFFIPAAPSLTPDTTASFQSPR